MLVGYAHLVCFISHFNVDNIHVKNICILFIFSIQRYHGAHVLLHALQYQTQNEEDKNSLTVYKEAVEKRLHILEEQGFVMAYQTLNN